MNRLFWDYNNAVGIMVAPGSYRVKITSAGQTETQPLALKLDPRLAEDGVTVADLKEQYDQNMHARDLVNEMNRVANRVRLARTKLRSGGDPAQLKKVEELGVAIFGAGEGIRYGQPGLQTNVTYLASMTGRADQRIGRDAIDRLATLRRELDAVEARVNQVLGPEKPLIP
jgi:hypothetical protein